MIAEQWQRRAWAILQLCPMHHDWWCPFMVGHTLLFTFARLLTMRSQSWTSSARTLITFFCFRILGSCLAKEELSRERMIRFIFIDCDHQNRLQPLPARPPLPSSLPNPSDRTPSSSPFPAVCSTPGTDRLYGRMERVSRTDFIKFTLNRTCTIKYPPGKIMMNFFGEHICQDLKIIAVVVC